MVIKLIVENYRSSWLIALEKINSRQIALIRAILFQACLEFQGTFSFIDKYVRLFITR